MTQHTPSPPMCRLGLIALGLLTFTGGCAPDTPLRYRHPMEAGSFSIVVSEWGVLAGTDPEGERVEVSMEAADGTLHKCAFEAFGRVTDSWCADLDADGTPEVVVITRSSGSGSYGEAWVVKFTHRGLLITQLDEMPAPHGQGYQGHDEFLRGGERRIVRTFPIYRDGDANASPSGGTRMIVYAFRDNKLVIAGTRDFPGAEDGSDADKSGTAQHHKL